MIFAGSRNQEEMPTPNLVPNRHQHALESASLSLILSQGDSVACQACACPMEFVESKSTKRIHICCPGSAESKEEEGNGAEEMLIEIEHAMLNSELEKMPSAVFEEVKISGFDLDIDGQSQLYRIVKPGSKVVIVGISSREAGVELTNDLKMMGFGDVLVAKEDDSQSSRFLVAKKPDWGASSKATLGATAKVNTTTQMKWSMGGGDLAEMDMVDEDDLLNDGITVDSAACAPPQDGGKKRACKNCSCGLAEQEASELKDEQTKVDPISRASGCGSCGKGDAFRCASCPFLGKPAFEPGQEKVILAMSDDI